MTPFGGVPAATLATDSQAGRAESSITAILQQLQRAILDQPDARTTTLRTLLVVMERSSFPALLLVFSMLLVSPLSAIPGATTVLGLTIAAILGQFLLGRQHAWLPAFLLDRPIQAARTLRALRRLDGPADWLERRLRRRLGWLFHPPLSKAPKLLAFMAALCAPLMEVIPASGTSVGAAITLFSAGLLARDGVFVLVGACLAAIMPVALWLFLT